MWYTIHEGGEILESTIGERIKAVRKSVKLSQTDFGARIGMGLGVVRNFESGITTPSNIQIELICKVFHVNPEWLNTGQGEMFRDLSREEKIAALVGEALADEDENFICQIIQLLTSLNTEQLEQLLEITKTFYKRTEEQKAAVQKQKEEE